MPYSRSANLKELLAPSNPYRATRSTGNGCSRCLKRCDCCNHFLISAESFSSTITGRLYYIRKTLNCSSPNVVYLAQCVTCGLQGVGSTVNFKSRLANYKSHIKRRRRTCGIVNHFIDKHDSNFSSLKFILIDQKNGNLRKCENFWIGTLLTNVGGMNSTHDFSQQ